MRFLILGALCMSIAGGCTLSAPPQSPSPRSTMAPDSVSNSAPSRPLPSGLAASSAPATAVSPGADGGRCVPCGEGIVLPVTDSYATPKWQTFRAADGAFTLDVPGPLRDEVRRVADGTELRGGRVTVRGVNYVVVYSQPPDPSRALAQSLQMLQTSLHAHAERRGVDSWRLTYTLPGGSTATHLMWTTNHDLCEAIAVLPTAHAAAREAEVLRFLASVKHL